MAKLNLVRDPARDFITLIPSGEQWQGLIWVVHCIVVSDR